MYSSVIPSFICALRRGRCCQIQSGVQIERFRQTFTPTYHDDLLKPTGYVMHQQFYIQQLYALPALYLCVLCLSVKKQRLVPLTA